MLMPKRLKYRRQHRGRMKGKATRGTELYYGDYAIKAMEAAWITSDGIDENSADGKVLNAALDELAGKCS